MILHWRNSPTADISSFHHIVIEAFQNKSAFDFGRDRIVPEVFEFIGIGFEIKKLAQAITMIDDQLLSFGPIHRSE